MEIVQVNNQKPKENMHHVDARAVYNKPHAQVVIISLHPKESLKPHKTPVDVFFYVLEGTGTVTIGDEQHRASKDTIIHSPANIIHSWSNESDALVRIMVVKTPNPTFK